jgi:hypothetical protein
VDNSFDKLNSEFADKARGGFKYWFWLIFSYLFAVVGVGFGVYAVLPGNNRYIALLTLLCGAFGVQTNAWSKGTQARNKPLQISFIANLVVVVFACVILYIILPYVNG